MNTVTIDGIVTPIIDIPPTTGEFFTEDGRYFINSYHMLSMLHDSLHDLVDLAEAATVGADDPAHAKEVIDYANLLSHTLLGNALDNIETLILEAKVARS